jgi:hypothetical protein
MEQIAPKDPLAGYRRTMKQVMADPLARQREVLEKVAAPNRMAEISQIIKPVPPPDPFAQQRKLMEQIATNPIAEYNRVIQKLTSPPDPLVQQRRIIEQIVPGDPLAEYRRIVDNFLDAMGGAIHPAPPAPEGVNSASTGALTYALADWALVFHLLAIAWLCHWLIDDGVNVERLGALMVDAVALAYHLSRSE